MNNDIKEWILPFDSEDYDIYGALKGLKIIDWKQQTRQKNTNVGDIVYIYKKATATEEGAIIFKGAVLKTGKMDNFIDDSKFRLDGKTELHPPYMEIAMFRQYDIIDKLTYSKLKEAGLVSNLMGAETVKGSLLNYLHECDEEQKSIDRFDGYIPDTCLVNFPMEVREVWMRADNEQKALDEEQLLIEGSGYIDNCIDVFLDNLSIYKKKDKELEKLRLQFVKDYNIKTIMNMKLEEYVVGLQRKDTFCYRLETELKELGDMHGSTATKFGVYYGKKGANSEIKYRFTNKFGKNLEEAFDKVKEEIVLLYIAGEKSDYNAIINSKFGDLVRGKILSVFFPEKYIAIFSEEHLDHFMNCLSIPANPNYDIIDKQNAIVEWKLSNKKLAPLSNSLFGAFLYSSFGRPLEAETDIKKVQKERDKAYPRKYVTKVDISKEDWKDLLRDPSVFKKKDIELLKRFYCSDNHATTCYDLSLQDGVNPTSYITPIVALAQRVSDAMNLEPILDDEGKRVWWRIIFWGKYREDARFEWKLQPKLADAMSEIYPYLDIGEANDLEDQALIEELRHASLRDSKEGFEYNGKKKMKGTPVYTSGQKIYPRDRQVAINALSHAGYLCEIDRNHPSFIRKNSDKNYTEPHHLVPIAFSEEFSVSLDVEENIVSLCSNCHNEIHYGRDAVTLIEKLYYERQELLKKVGINITLERLLEMYNVI